MVTGLAAVYGEHLLVVHGAARGADEMAEQVAQSHGIPTCPFPAEWEVHDRVGSTPVRCRCAWGQVRCRAAGPRRNQKMLDEGHPNIVIAFAHDLSRSRGTADMVRRSITAGIPTWHMGLVLPSAA